VAAASTAGPGRFIPKSRPSAQAQMGSATDPLIVASLKAMP